MGARTGSNGKADNNGAGSNVVALCQPDERLTRILAEAAAAQEQVAQREKLFPSLLHKRQWMETHLPTVEKNTNNEDDGWSYASIDRIINAVKELQGPLGISISFKPQTERTEQKTIELQGNRRAWYSKVYMEMHVSDLDSGESDVQVAEGESWDANGKSLNQAITFGRRNGICTYFNIVTGDEVKNEGDRTSQQMAQGEVAAPQPSSSRDVTTVAEAAKTVSAATPPAATNADDLNVPIDQLFPAQNKDGGKAELVATIYSLLKPKGKTLADVNKLLRGATHKNDADITNVAENALHLVIDKLQALPDHLIPFEGETTAAAA
jgi:hypothetical protein